MNRLMSTAARLMLFAVLTVGVMAAGLALGGVASDALRSDDHSHPHTQPQSRPAGVSEVMATAVQADLLAGGVTVSEHRLAVDALASCMSERGHELARVGLDFSQLLTRYAIEESLDEGDFSDVEQVYDDCYEAELLLVDAAYQESIADELSLYYLALNQCLENNGIALPQQVHPDSAVFPDQELEFLLATDDPTFYECVDQAATETNLTQRSFPQTEA